MTLRTAVNQTALQSQLLAQSVQNSSKTVLHYTTVSEQIAALLFSLWPLGQQDIVPPPPQADKGAQGEPMITIPKKSSQSPSEVWPEGQWVDLTWLVSATTLKKSDCSQLTHAPCMTVVV